MKRIFSILIVFILYSPIFAEVEVEFNLNLDSDNNKQYTKYSDWVPYRLHKQGPKFLEDFYELYGLKLHYDENDLKRDIYFLKTGLNKKFRHPRNALCPIKSDDEYYKYRLLVTMQIHIQIMRSTLRLGSIYDKRHLYFHNLDYAYDLKKSFTIALAYYKEALPYWKKSKEFAQKASKIRKEIGLGTLETERQDIVTGKLNFEKIIEDHIERVVKKLKTVEDYIQKNPNANKPMIDEG